LIKDITLHNIRSLGCSTLKLGHKLSVVVGSNGAGKTSILEAISIVSTGKSFRTRQIETVISNDRSELVVFCRKDNESSVSNLGIKRDRKGSYKVKVDGQSSNSLVDLSRALPAFIITPDFYDDFLTTRASRIKLLDQGLFHVEHDFYQHWKSFNKILKQRNALLKSIREGKSQRTALGYWDETLCLHAEMIDELRRKYLSDLKPRFRSYCSAYNDFHQSLEIEFNSGWNNNEPLINELNRSIERDVSRGFTHFGAHKADITFKFDGKKAVDYASRGQQKIMVNNFMLATIEQFIGAKNKPCIVAIDDLASELDQFHQEGLVTALLALNGAQIVITCIDINSLPEAVSGYNSAMFHVEHGTVNVIEKTDK
jgi:DNA replication and repair protein RecF